MFSGEILATVGIEEAGLGGDEDLRPNVAKGLPEQSFAMAVPVQVRSIEEGDTTDEGSLQYRERRAVVGADVDDGAVVGSDDAPRAEADLADHRSRAAKTSVVHVSSAPQVAAPRSFGWTGTRP